MAIFDTKPYNDDYMTYDYTTHFYMLTEKAVFDNLGENLGAFNMQAPNSTNWWLRRISREVRRYVLANSQSPDYVLAMLATDGALRPLVLEMLLAQAEEELRPSDNERVRESGGIALDVQDVANRILPGYGHSMRYCGGGLPRIAPAALYKGW